MEMKPQKVIFCDIDADAHMRDYMIGANGLVTLGIQYIDFPGKYEVEALFYDKIEDFGRQIGAKLARHYEENKGKLKLQVNFDVNFGDSGSFSPFYDVLDWLQVWMNKYPDLDVYLTSSTGYLDRDSKDDGKAIKNKLTKLNLETLKQGLKTWSDVDKTTPNNAQRMAHVTKKHFGDQFYIHYRSGFGFKCMFEKILSSS